MDIDKAISFVRSNGDRLELARLKNIMGEEFDTQDILRGFTDLQNPDGGFPFGDRKGFPSCLSNTAQAIHTFLELDLSDSEPAIRSLDFLLANQTDEGSWEENPQVMPLDPPFWDIPGDPRTTVWLTADITDILVRLGREDERIERAVEFLKGNQSPDGKFRGFIHSTWIAAAIFGKNGYDDKTVWKDAMAYLGTLEFDDWDASSIVWCLDCLLTGGADTGSGLWARLSERLQTLQLEDGSWESADGEEYRAQTTIAVLAVLKNSGSI